MVTGPNSLGWLSRCPDVLHPSASDASGERAAAAAAAAQELLSTSQASNEVVLCVKTKRKECAVPCCVLLSKVIAIAFALK
eukprot:1151964-Pelagomonas_calceolata.AAC.7